MLDVKADFEEKIGGKIAENPEGAKLVDAIFMFKIVGEGGGTWTLNLKDDPGVTPGDTGSAECTVECDIEDWRAMREDGSIAMRLFMEGKLKLTGNVMLATKLQQVLAGPGPREGAAADEGVSSEEAADDAPPEAAAAEAADAAPSQAADAAPSQAADAAPSQAADEATDEAKPTRETPSDD